MNTSIYQNQPYQLLNIQENFLPLVSKGWEYGFEKWPIQKETNFYVLKQVHGIDIIDAQSYETGSQSLMDADGLYFLTKSEKPIAIKTADCLPVILASSNGKCGMVVHGGWRGLSQGILREAVKIFINQGIPSKEISALIGPAISQENYQIKRDVLDAMRRGLPELDEKKWDHCIRVQEKEHWVLDLKSVAAYHMQALGIPRNQIGALNVCTYANEEWASHRREGVKRTHNNWTWLHHRFL